MNRITLIFVISLILFLSAIPLAAQQQLLLGVGAGASGAAPVVPTLVQWSLGSSSETAAAGNGGGGVTSYDFYLPNTTQSGNAIVGCVTGGSTSATMSISDDGSNSYTVIATATNASTTARIYAFRAINTSPARKLTFTPSATIDRVAPVIAEFNNVSTSSADDGHADGNSDSGSSTFTAGSNTTGIFTGSGTTGDLLFQCAYRSQTPFVNAATPYTIGSQSNITWSFVGTDAIDGLSAQWGQYSSTSSISPAYTTGNNSGYVTAAIALKTATAGAARPSGMQVVGIQHVSVNPDHSGTTPLLMQFPTEGNTFIASIGPGGASYQITGITDGNSNTWSTVTPVAGDGSAGKNQFLVAQGTTASKSMTMSVATSGGGTADQTILLYDVVNGGSIAYRGYVQNMDLTGSVAFGNVTPYQNLPTGATDGMAFHQMSVAQNTCSGASGPSGIAFDASFAHGLSLSGPMPVDQNNCWAHNKFTATTVQTPVWSFTQDAAKATQAWSGGSVYLVSNTGTAYPYRVQSKSNASTGTGTTVTLAFACKQAGNLLAIGTIRGTNNGSAITLTDTQSNTITAIDGPTAGTFGEAKSWEVLSCANTTSSTYTATFASSNTTRSIWIDEFDKAGGTFTLDVHNLRATTSSGGGAFSTANLTTGTAVEVVWGVGWCNNSCSDDANNPGNGRGTTFQYGVSDGHSNPSIWKIVVSTGTYTVDFIDSGGTGLPEGVIGATWHQ